MPSGRATQNAQVWTQHHVRQRKLPTRRKQHSIASSRQQPRSPTLKRISDSIPGSPPELLLGINTRPYQFQRLMVPVRRGILVCSSPRVTARIRDLLASRWKGTRIILSLPVGDSALRLLMPLRTFDALLRRATVALISSSEPYAAAKRTMTTVRCRTSQFVSLFEVGREHIFDPFHECADSARQIAPMCHYQGDLEQIGRAHV